MLRLLRVLNRCLGLRLLCGDRCISIDNRFSNAVSGNVFDPLRFSKCILFASSGMSNRSVGLRLRRCWP